MAKNKTILSWSNTKELAFLLIDEHPQVDPNRLSLAALQEMVLNLPDFTDSKDGASNDILESLRERWYSERMDMEDELGPLRASEDEDEELDEDAYRADRVAVDDEEDDDSFEEEDDDDDEFDDGYSVGDDFSDEEEY